MFELGGMGAVGVDSPFAATREFRSFNTNKYPSERFFCKGDKYIYLSRYGDGDISYIVFFTAFQEKVKIDFIACQDYSLVTLGLKGCDGSYEWGTSPDIKEWWGRYDLDGYINKKPNDKYLEMVEGVFPFMHYNP